MKHRLGVDRVAHTGMAPRRRALQWGLGGAAALIGAPWWARRAHASSEGAPRREAPRLALLIGNRDYPDDEDLPPIHKNVRDLRDSLQLRGFEVRDGLDLDLAESRSLIDSFASRVAAAGPDATVLFYFSGHGAQVDAENLLVPARLNPKARPEVLVRGSMTLGNDVISRLPIRREGLTMLVVDACRTSLRDVALGEGLNQVEAPAGCLIAFSTGAGRPAIAPNDPDRLTFYTASLVRLLTEASDEISFSDLFRLVKFDVQDVMLNHPVALLRRFAQFPFIAENTQVRRRLAPLPPEAAAAPPPRFADRNEAEDWERLATALWPADVLRLANDYLAAHPDSRVAGSAQVARLGAREAVSILRRNDVRLFRSGFEPASDIDDTLREELAKAGRGDKDAAARLGRLYRRDAAGGDRGRYEGWLQYAAALGNGIASYELALHYRREGQPLLAGQYETRARALGYTPPPSLDNTRK
jgi:hypothetical protein